MKDLSAGIHFLLKITEQYFTLAKIRFPKRELPERFV